MATSDSQVRSVSRLALLRLLSWILPSSPVIAYVLNLLMGFEGQEAVRAILWLLPPILGLGGVGWPLVVTRILVRRALKEPPAGNPTARLDALLELPQKLVLFCLVVLVAICAPAFLAGSCLLIGKSVANVPAATGVALAYILLVGVPLNFQIEADLLPLVLEESRRLGKHRFQAREFDFFFPRQTWFFPYVFGALLLATLALTGTVAAVKLGEHQDQIIQSLQEAGVKEAIPYLESARDNLWDALWGPVFGTAAFVFAVAMIVGLRLARRQAAAALAVQRSLDSLASGQLIRPEWVSTDETGDVAQGLVQVLDRLAEIPRNLGLSAQQLLEAGKGLSSATSSQNESIQRQAAALEQTQVTATEIRQTSLVAVQKANDVLKVAGEVDAISESGERAIQQSTEGLNAIRKVVEETRERVAQLANRAQQISSITLTVKDLADQSNMLALNAAIEAARSGEAGRAFEVVAREIRGLADQSLQATRKIGEILGTMDKSVRDVSRMFDSSSEQLAHGLDQVHESGNAVRQLAAIAREGTTAARQIAAAVSQQSAGVQQIFSALTDLSDGMQRTVAQASETAAAQKTLGEVAHRVQAVANQYRVAPDLASDR